MVKRNETPTAEAQYNPAVNEQGLKRREMVATGAGLVVALALSVGSASEADAAVAPEKEYTQPGDRILLVKGTNKNEFLRPEMLTVGERPVEAFPFASADNVVRRKNRLNRLLILRLDPAEMNEETRNRSVDGVLAYSALCTHRACTIKSWMAEERYVRCHCHLSKFAALEQGSVKGGPARRNLPMVPLGLDDEGYVVATGEFTTKPGPAKK